MNEQGMTPTVPTVADVTSVLTASTEPAPTPTPQLADTSGNAASAIVDDNDKTSGDTIANGSADVGDLGTSVDS